MVSAFFIGVSDERAAGRRSSHHAVAADALETWLLRASPHDAQQVVVAHQAHELWFNQLLCELAVLVADLDADVLPAANRTLERAARIAAVLVEQMRELRSLRSAGRGRLDALLGEGTEIDRERLRRLERIAGTRTAASGRWMMRERRPERPRSTSVREAFLRAVAREPGGDAEVVVSRTPALAEVRIWLATRLARPTVAAQCEIAVGLRELDERLFDWARHRDALCHGSWDGEGRAGAPLARRFFPDLWG